MVEEREKRSEVLLLRSEGTKHHARDCHQMFADAKQLGSSVPDSKKRSEERPELFCTRCYERKKGKEYPGWGNRTTQRCFLHTGDSLTKEKKEEKSKKEKKERKEEKRKEAKKEKKQKSMGEGEESPWVDGD